MWSTRSVDIVLRSKISSAAGGYRPRPQGGDIVSLYSKLSYFPIHWEKIPPQNIYSNSLPIRRTCGRIATL